MSQKSTRRTARMLAVSAAALFLVALPALAGQPHRPVPPGAGEGAYRGECRRMTRQIAHYADVVDMARARDNDLWAEATIQHIGRLTERRARLCPQYADTPAGEQLMKLLRLAGKVALKMFTMGLI